MGNSLCDKFRGRNTCDYILANGACKLPNKFMCIVLIKTGSQPINDDVPLFLKEVLEAFPDSKVVKEINPEPREGEYPMELIPPEIDEEDRWVEPEKPVKKTMEDYFGKI